jgi:hypothetical protein
MELRVNDYVRTTYGIGKIENAYIVYSDDGALWHLCYTTDNPKIEIGIYTKANSWELFGEIQKDHSIKYEPLNVNTQKYFDMVYKQKLEEPVCYVPVVNGIPRNAELFDDHKFIKSNPNIIDLIEVGDYVNGYYVEDITHNTEEYVLHIITGSNYFQSPILYEEDIKSIVTREQFSQMEYKVKE